MKPHVLEFLPINLWRLGVYTSNNFKIDSVLQLLPTSLRSRNEAGEYGLISQRGLVKVLCQQWWSMRSLRMPIPTACKVFQMVTYVAKLIVDHVAAADAECDLVALKTAALDEYAVPTATVMMDPHLA